MTTLLEEATSTFNELLRLHKLNTELIETLSVTAQWFRSYAEKHNTPFPNSSTYDTLINKAEALIQEIALESPMELQSYPTEFHRKNHPTKTSQNPEMLELRPLKLLVNNAVAGDLNLGRQRGRLMSQPKSFVYRKKGTQLGADGVFRLIAFASMFYY